MHKEAQQAAGGPTSLEATSEEGAHPQLSSESAPGHDASTDFTAEVDPGIFAPKLEDLADILKDTRSAFFTPNSLTCEPIIISDMSEEEENAKTDKDIEDTSVPPPFLKLAQLQTLMAQVHLLQSQKKELEQAKVKAKAEVALMKAKPSYLDINQLTELLITYPSIGIKSHGVVCLDLCLGGFR
nr:hypothetical protein [Tanacetum cinerariifolium]